MWTQTKRRLLILYGSQTGTCEDVSQRIVMQSRGSNFECVCKPLDDYDINKLIGEKLVVFVCSTTGQGTAPDNMRTFWKFIMRKCLPATSLSDLKFGVLGLGDSSYAKFNVVAKKLHRRLLGLGAEALFKLGLADDQHEWGAESVVDSWIVNMWTHLLRLYPASSEFTSPLKLTKLQPRFTVAPAEVTKVNGTETSPEHPVDLCKSEGPYNQKNPLLSLVKENRRVTSEDHFQETRLLTLDTQSGRGHTSLSYEPGDVVMIQPENIEHDVDDFVNTLNFDSEALINVFPVSDKDPAPKILLPTTLRQLATRYLDFKAIPGRTFFLIFALFANDENEREKLMQFGSLEGTEDRYDYINRPRRNILEVMKDFHLTTARITQINVLFDLIPFIRPRAFSVASSPSVHRNEVHVLVAVVKYKTRLHQRRTGLCSTYVSKLERGDKVNVWMKRGGINFNYAAPNIMVGPGTGIAPFRSACYELVAKGRHDSVVLFGCRGSKTDFYFEDEWRSFGDSVKLLPAFSRDQEDKIYVQHIIKEEGKLLYDLITRQSASIYVAGNSKNMPDAVRDAFIELFKEHGNETDEDAAKSLKKLQEQKRYQQETWS